ncbi:MAG: 50S ribosomal protein L25/general stress protein Ctc [Microbacteriaceae bacterium]|nr:50S ribosomal protein L25/general stress protein Ctc [Microbacteriaceae bacterium]
MSATKLEAEKRDTFGKGVARKLRVVGKTPIVIYGHGEEPRHYSVDTHALSLIVRTKNALIDLQFEDGSHQLALVKDVQKDHVRQLIEHADLLIVRKGETVQVEVPLVTEGESFAGTAALLELNTLSVEAPATHIPENFTIDIEGAEEGTQIFAKDIKLPGDVTLLTDAEELIVNVIVPQEDLPEVGEEGAERAEGEAGEVTLPAEEREEKEESAEDEESEEESDAEEKSAE